MSNLTASTGVNAAQTAAKDAHDPGPTGPHFRREAHLRPCSLTTRGRVVIVLLALIALPWAASALGYWLTGVSG